MAISAITTILFLTSCQKENTVAVTGVNLNKTTVGLVVGGTETLTATVLPEDATDKEVEWISGNSAVVPCNRNIRRLHHDNRYYKERWQNRRVRNNGNLRRHCRNRRYDKQAHRGVGNRRDRNAHSHSPA